MPTVVGSVHNDSSEVSVKPVAIHGSIQLNHDHRLIRAGFNVSYIFCTSAR